jgi:hypothetical protein
MKTSGRQMATASDAKDRHRVANGIPLTKVPLTQAWLVMFLPLERLF